MASRSAKASGIADAKWLASSVTPRRQTIVGAPLPARAPARPADRTRLILFQVIPLGSTSAEARSLEGLESSRMRQAFSVKTTAPRSGAKQDSGCLGGWSSLASHGRSKGVGVRI